jgi:hypothetical protein
MDLNLFELFAGRRYIFSIIDEPHVAVFLTLRDDGWIGEYKHPNEVTWAIDAGALVICDAMGRPSNIFDKAEMTETGWVLYGKFLLGPDPTTHYHKLTEVGHAPRSVAKVVKEAPLHPNAEHAVAVLVRTHRIDEKFNSLWDKLNRGRRNFDVYPIVDETGGRLSDVPGLPIRHSAQASRELGLTQPRGDLLYFCGDIPYYFALRELPEYSHYLMIEYDIELTADDASFIARLCDRLAEPAWSGTDFVGLRHSVGRDAPWYEACRKQLPDRYCFFCYFPFSILSRRAAAYLFTQRQLEAARQTPAEEVVHCETFIPSFAAAGGFRCHDLSDLMPGCYRFDLMAMQLGKTAMGKPMGFHLSVEPGIGMIHPVYSHSEYAWRLRKRYVEGPDKDADVLRRYLESDEAKVVPAEMLTELWACVETGSRND